MNASVWHEMTKLEKDLMTCAMEAWGILPYACEAADDSSTIVANEDQAAALLSLVDRGWVHVCRLEPWTNPDGHTGVQHGEPIDRDALPELLADPDTWDDPDDGSWIGELTLTQTEVWRQKLTAD